MSTWHVNRDWPDFYAADRGPVFWVDPDDSFVDPVIDPRDVLSAPLVESLLFSGLSLWPRGSAWGTPDGEAPSTVSRIAGLTRALLSPFVELYAKAWRLTEESRSASLVDSLEDWERDFGLPENCSSEGQTLDARLAILRARVARLATITPADVIRLAARLGYVVAIEEPDAFLAGESTCLGLGELSAAGLERQWVVLVRYAPFTQFETGIGEAGIDRLLGFDHDVLECEIRRISPGWTTVIFNYAEQPIASFLVTETGARIVTENGHPLIMRLFASSL
ncbi:putative phage tail protein [Hoeflea sp. BAL378]|uniref:putative phage tail protein n=1 Tax=Hoeflea sp. BAL378 TaxID=1547437 RepID=UPI00068A201B|nr:putative phage tail protein [Hoeflea sp. BAL378]